MRIVFVTQQVDPGHPALAATVPKIRALAERVDEVVVLADRTVAGTLPDNCRSISFSSRTKAGRGARFEAALTRELTRRPRPSAIVAHMCPIYAVLAAPVARPLGVPIVLWFTHWKRTRTLEAAMRVSTAVASVDRRSVPLDSAKVVAIGHGIDLDEFPCRSERKEGGDFRLAVLGRYSLAKGLVTMIQAVRIALDGGLDARLEVHGPSLNAVEREHRIALERLLVELDLSRRVRLDHAVLRSEVPQVFARADALVNNMEAGSLDKIVYEAAASCLPVVVSNPGFDTLVAGLEPPLLFSRDNPDELAARLSALAAVPSSERHALGHRLRERVAERHSVQSWAEGILRAANTK